MWEVQYLSIQKTIWKREPTTGLREVARKRYFSRNSKKLICESRITKLFSSVLRCLKIDGERFKPYGIVSTKKAPEDVAELEALRSWNHELHFTKICLDHWRKHACRKRRSMILL